LKRLLFVLTLAIGASVAGHSFADDETDASIAWVKSLDSQCVYDDGYVCNSRAVAAPGQKRAGGWNSAVIDWPDHQVLDRPQHLCGI